jgi:hypothetical protein
VQFDESEVGQFFSQFSGHLPDTLLVTGNVLINPPEVYNPTIAGAGGVGRNCTFGGFVNLEVPLMLGISNGVYRDTLVVGDTTGDGVRDYSVNRDKLRNMNRGTVFLDLVNAMPLEVGLTVHLLDAHRQVLLILPQSGGRIRADAAQVDPGGNSVLPVTSRSSIQLLPAEVDQLDSVEFVAYEADFSTTAGSPAVRFRISDYVNIRAWSILSYRVNQ